MKTVALISGGKDSCFNMVQCVAEGHEIVALANLKPRDKDELDSYMYQTVGHQAIDLYAEAMDLPLYRHTIQGTAVSTSKDYMPLEADEVEDLYQLLEKVKSELEVEAVAVGAILSDYQRIRVENVCQRLGLTPLAYLWRREQSQLLQEMVDCGMEAIIIKVAAMGLDPDKHLGLTLKEILPHMLKMEKEYGLNVCGEGGEYETLTLDCPLFKQRIVVDEKETVIHSPDAFAPVSYIRFNKLHLEQKNDAKCEFCTYDKIRGLPLTTSTSLMANLVSGERGEEATSSTLPDLPLPAMTAVTDPDQPCYQSKENYFNIGNLAAMSGEDVGAASRQAMDTLQCLVERLGGTLSDVFCVCLYVRKMSDFAAVNSVYKTYFGINPPVRVCVETLLPHNYLFLLDCQGWRDSCGGRGGSRRTMHVQGLSHWAPANIGPYSQATVVDGRVYVAGQIPLVPGTMTLLSGDITAQLHLSLQHVNSILDVMCPGVAAPDALLTVCYVVHPRYIQAARQHWRSVCDSREVTGEEDSCRPESLLECVVVPALPRAACVEWQVYTPVSGVRLTEVKTSIITSKYLVHCRCLISEDQPGIFASQTCVSFVAKAEEELDCGEAVSQWLECYSALLTKLGRDWSCVPLLRIFYPAKLCSYQSLVTSWRQTLDEKSVSDVTFCLVPVIQLSDDTKCLSVCH